MHGHRSCETGFGGGNGLQACGAVFPFAMRQSAVNRSRPSRHTPAGLEPPGASVFFRETRQQSNGGRAELLAKL